MQDSFKGGVAEINHSHTNPKPRFHTPLDMSPEANSPKLQARTGVKRRRCVFEGALALF